MKPFIPKYPDGDISTRYWIESGKNLRIEEYHGPIALSDWRTMTSAITSDPAFSPDHHGLMDFTRASLQMSTNDVIRMGLLMRRQDYLSNGWQLFVVNSSADFGNIRMLSRWARNENRLKIFNRRCDADAWFHRNGSSYPFCVQASPASFGAKRISA
ncbi:hypothetical protein JIN85_03950 [Luteolibacter pohnpeiensis]|uniref:Uncharacterized protein n=1 Tax=Luteolibacter pohnpeiensis TaxID=454153 RepID=A0A934VVI2_9BACT|nr:hypothetical protein [Luteolibacter pohnpeiensis]MBK1881554.1 hypothetical protein [Luteolibacter pohnpeiensis]